MLIDVLEVTKNHHLIPPMKEWMDSEEFYKMSSIMSAFPVREGKMAKNYPEITLYYGSGLAEKIEKLEGVVNFSSFIKIREIETPWYTRWEHEVNKEKFVKAIQDGKTIFMDLELIHEYDKNLAFKIFQENLDAKIILLVRESKDNHGLPYLNKVEVRAISKVFHYI